MIKPLADRVVVEPKEAETKTASGLYIPDTAKEKPQQGTVIAVGPGTKDVEMEVKVGDVVLYGKYAGTGLIRRQEIPHYETVRHSGNHLIYSLYRFEQYFLG